MLNLMDYLKDDLHTIEGYIGAYGIPLSDYIGSDIYLSNWNSCKKKLFHLLGGQLIYEKEIEIEKDESILRQDISLLRETYFYFINNIKNYIIENYFDLGIFEVDKFKASSPTCFWSARDNVLTLFDTEPLMLNRLTRAVIFYNYKKNKYLRFDKNTKVIKVINKVLDFYDMLDLECENFLSNNPSYSEVFEKFRIAHSMVLNEKKLKGTLCLSIHPLDFMSMSDNSYDWSSCMSWMKSGCYHAGTVEMMNSNNVICAYLKGKDPFCWTYKDKEYQWTNKKWRQLFYVTKDIIVGGKAYPYFNKNLTFIILETLRELAIKNWNRTYEFGIEPYRDMIHINSMREMAKNYNWIHSGNTKKKNIIFHSKGMYNDMYNDSQTTYYCIRNKVKKNTIITYSGKCNCIKCNGNVLTHNFDIDNSDFIFDDYESYNERYANVNKIICRDCLNKNYLCDCCGDYAPLNMYHFPFGEKICGSCLSYKKFFICPCCGEISFLSEEFQNQTLFVLKDANKPLEFYLKDFEKDEYSYNNTICYIYIPSTFIYDHRAIICDKCRDNIVSKENLESEKIKYDSWSGRSVTINKINSEIVKKYLNPKFKYENFFSKDICFVDKAYNEVEQFKVY